MKQINLCQYWRILEIDLLFKDLLQIKLKWACPKEDWSFVCCLDLNFFEARWQTERWTRANNCLFSIFGIYFTILSHFSQRKNTCRYWKEKHLFTRNLTFWFWPCNFFQKISTLLALIGVYSCPLFLHELFEVHKSFFHSRPISFFTLRFAFVNISNPSRLHVYAYLRSVFCALFSSLYIFVRLQENHVKSASIPGWKLEWMWGIGLHRWVT